MKRSGNRMLQRGRVPALAALALSVLALGACGSSSSKTAGDSHSTAAVSTTPATTISTVTTGPQASPKRPKPGPGHPKRYPKSHGKHGPAHLQSLGPQLSVAALERKADAACKAADTRQAALSRPGDFTTNSKAAAAYLRQLVSIKATETTALRMNPPHQLRQQYASFAIDMLREESFVLVAGGMAQAGQSGYVKQYQTALSFSRSTTAPAARTLHLTACS